MRSHKFINSLLYLITLLVAKESRANENNGGIRCFFVLFIDKLHISQVIHFKECCDWSTKSLSSAIFSTPFVVAQFRGP